MLSKRSLAALSHAERQALWLQARQRGQCIRCFHSSIRQFAEDAASQEETNKATPSPKANLVEKVSARPGGDSIATGTAVPTKPSRARHQRSAMISEEVQMIQRDHPSPSFADSNPNMNTRRPPPTAQTINPIDSPMGANDPVSKEGPTAQGAGRPVATEEDAADTSIMARGARVPEEGVEEPAVGGISAMGSLQEGRQQAPTMEERDSTDAFDIAIGLERSGPAGEEAIQPDQSLSKEGLLYAGHETATMASPGAQGMITDHLRLVAQPGQLGTARNTKHLARKMMSGQLVQFISEEERAATEDDASDIARAQADRVASQRKSGGKEARNYHFAPVSEGVRKSILDRLAAGVYDKDGLLQGKEKFKQPLLNQVARGTMMNSTYLKADGDRFVRKVQSLLPAMQRPQQKPQQAKRA